jgi:hypothetical protein
MENPMSLIASLITATSEEAGRLTMHPAGYAAIAVGAFIALAVVVWSYRDVSNRQSHKAAAHDDHHSAGH